MQTQVIRLFLIAVAIATVSCGGMKAGGSKGAKTYYETFFVGEQGTQYFIKPIKFKGENSLLKVDITFRYKNEIKDSSAINFSIISEKVVKDVDSVFISSGDHKILLNNVELIFNEKKKKLITSRFTGKVSVKDLNELFKSNPWKIDLKSSVLKELYMSSRQANKVIRKLQENVFILF